MEKELNIEDFISFVGDKTKKILVDINVKYEWFEGYVCGIDLVENRLRVSLDVDNGNLFFSRWVKLYFQLNKQNSKYYYVKIK